jgi:L-histidine N-alpha-methyltransferase
MTPSVTVESHLLAGWAEREMLEDVRRTFTSHPKVLRPKWLYDDRGSQLFNEITGLDEYYPTEAERLLLIDHAAEIARHTHADTIVELGSGTSDKTRTLLDAFWSGGNLTTMAPMDVSEQTLVDAAEMLARRYPGLSVHAVVGDFTRHLPHLPQGDRRMVAFLGSTIGNFYREERRAFLGALADTLTAGEWLLLGVDLVKDLDRLVDAYHDPGGTTARFIRNVLHSLNCQLDADFVVDLFDYVPLWDAHEERIDMRLRAAEPMTVRIGALDLETTFTEGEELRVEISTKFRIERLADELEDAGFVLDRTWRSTGSPDGHVRDADFGLILARRA